MTTSTTMTSPSRRTIRYGAIALLALAGLTGAAAAQTSLYSNAGPDASTPALAASPVTASGAPAPKGGLWSEVQHLNSTEANAVAGFSSHASGLTGAFRFADDFTVTGTQPWRLQNVALFAYQTDAAMGPSPFAGVNVRIWQGRPGDAGSTVVFGDTTTNRLLISTPTNIYRVFNTVTPPAQPTTTNRVIWQTTASLGSVLLQPGTYWIDWQYTSADPLSQAYSPAATAAGARTVPGANALQYALGQWIPVVDAGKPASRPDLPQDLPFILTGSVACAGDFNNDTMVNSQDFFDFLSAFFMGAPSADFNHDTLVNSQDFFDFLTAFFGCP